MNEATLQKKCIKHAKQHGWLAFKWASPAHRGVPDCLFFRDGRLVIIEFKSPAGTGRLSPLQVKTIGDLEATGFDVNVVNDFDYFCAILMGNVK
jgi:hypothetical protein